MIQSTQAVDAAFSELAAALDAESAEMKKVGGELFHAGAPHQAQSIGMNSSSSTRESLAKLQRRSIRPSTSLFSRILG